MINKVICTDDSMKPNDISIKNWVIKGNTYTVVKMCISKLTNDKYFVLDEISTGNGLYGGYNIKRFSIAPEDIEQLVKEKELELEEVD
jgi:hypothetical protein